ncbi:MAG: quinone-dependent dihydroorotate dehydrogenase [Candidatus Caenarcaniphilales bacterium]|nr:quinone-dependent dihydroorotate dehydrogenase [Candidatus Caenarcaniphilales bacterium]
MLYETLIRNFLFSMEPEKAHEFTLRNLHKFQNFFIRDKINDSEKLKVNVAGINFPNRIGLAAGMDKSCEAPLAWQGLGFGHVEMGSVTFHPQDGNPKPRLFRLPEEKSLLNRMGFNNPGASVVAARLAETKKNKKFLVPLGINIGKSRVVDPKKFSEVIEDYLGTVKLVQAHADYLVINVSSPNTPGLREWQSPKQLFELLSPIKQIAKKPLFLKISPDIETSSLEDILRVATEIKVDGIIATNTTVSRDGAPKWAKMETGGISGALLKQKSLEITKWLAQNKPAEMALISVGGISTADDVRERLALGANLVQVYSALVFAGPTMVSLINGELAKGL